MKEPFRYIQKRERESEKDELRTNEKRTKKWVLLSRDIQEVRRDRQSSGCSEWCKGRKTGEWGIFKRVESVLEKWKVPYDEETKPRRTL